MIDCDLLVVNVGLATMRSGTPYGAVRDGALAVRDGQITWVGARASLPRSVRAAAELDGEGGWLTPGLIDCHTHLVYAGNRAHEFELRLQGASYEDIARSGGGIVSTVRATRSASQTDLLALAQKRLNPWLAEGTAVIEVKSGYGLDRETELKMLRAA